MGSLSALEVWNNLILPHEEPSPEAKSFHVAAVYDSRYKEPWLLACPIALTGPAWHGLYRDRWPIEQVPLAAKQMVGASRQFVFAQESRYRLPQSLSLLAGSILTYQAAILLAISTGFWDRHPQPTAGRLRRALAEKPFSESYQFAGTTSQKGVGFCSSTQGNHSPSSPKEGCQPLKSACTAQIYTLFLSGNDSVLLFRRLWLSNGLSLLRPV